MRRISLAVAAITIIMFSALGAGIQSASAANYNWSGFYVGLNAGGNWGTSQATTAILPGGPIAGGCAACRSQIAAIGNQSFDTSGFTGGVQGGYNWQSGNLLVGIEFDYEYFRSNGSTNVTGLSPSCPCFVTINSSISTDWLFTARPRLGLVSNNWLFYGTGGLAVSKLKATWSYHDTLNPATSLENASASTTKAGWTVGGGVEAALPGNWLIGGEYLYVKFNSITGAGNYGNSAALDVINHSADLKTNIIRARFSKKF